MLSSFWCVWSFITASCFVRLNAHFVKIVHRSHWTEYLSRLWQAVKINYIKYLYKFICVQDQLTEEDPVYTNTTDVKFKKKEHLATAQTNAAETKNLPSPSSGSQTVDNGRWENDDGLIYVTPFFDVGGQVRRPLHPRKEEADYCTLRLIQTKMSASDEDADHWNHVCTRFRLENINVCVIGFLRRGHWSF